MAIFKYCIIATFEVQVNTFLKTFVKDNVFFFQATVERMVREGARVTLCDLPTSEGAAVASALGADKCIFAPCDITKEEDVTAALDATVEKVG